MAEQVRDKWSEWLLGRRDGGDPEQRRKTLEFLAPVREKILEKADLSGGETLLDVGAGDGLIAFGALDLIGDEGTAIFSDVSRDLLGHSRKLAGEMGVLERCRFVEASADDLSTFEDESVDVVTTRSVLIYVEDKKRAFAEFHRVLKPGGRVSIWEPINNFRDALSPDFFLGYDTSRIEGLARKVRDVYRRIQPDTDPMLDFDERDLFDFAEKAGFEEVGLDFEARTRIGSAYNEDKPEWGKFIMRSGNPKIPTLEEAMDEALSPEERERFISHLRPLVEGGRQRLPLAVAYLWAVRSKER